METPPVTVYPYYLPEGSWNLLHIDAARGRKLDAHFVDKNDRDLYFMLCKTNDLSCERVPLR